MAERDTTSIYLDLMDSVEFLSKKDQIAIGHQIKNSELEIIKSCIHFQDFKNQLASLKVNIERNPNNIIKYSKLLEDGSSKRQRYKIQSYFNQLFESLQANDHESSLKALDQIKLTSSTLNQLLVPIKEKFRKLEESTSGLKRIFKFLEVDSIPQFTVLSVSIENPDYRKALCKHLYTQESRLLNYFQEGKEIIDFLKKEGLNEESINNLTTLYNTITKLEESVKIQRSRLIDSNLPLVVSRAKKFLNKGLEFDDLIQEGNIGLIKAVDKFEPTKDIKLTTYATWWVDQAIRRAISNKSKTVRIPIHIQDVLQSINKAYHVLCHTLSREPSHEEIAIQSGLALKVVKEMHQIAQHEVNIEDEVVTGITYMDVISDKASNTPQQAIALKLRNQRLKFFLSQLEPKYEKVLRLRFGIGEIREDNDDEGLVLQDIGKQLGVTRERARQVIKKGMSKISNIPGISELKDQTEDEDEID